jgi:hypothetical protein
MEDYALRLSRLGVDAELHCATLCQTRHNGSSFAISRNVESKYERGVEPERWQLRVEGLKP